MSLNLLSTVIELPAWASIFWKLNESDLFDSPDQQECLFLRSWRNCSAFAPVFMETGKPKCISLGVRRSSGAHSGRASHSLPGPGYWPSPREPGSCASHPGGCEGHRLVPPGNSVHRRDWWEADQPHPTGHYKYHTYSDLILEGSYRVTCHFLFIHKPKTLKDLLIPSFNAVDWNH